MQVPQFPLEDEEEEEEDDNDLINGNGGGDNPCHPPDLHLGTAMATTMTKTMTVHCGH